MLHILKQSKKLFFMIAGCSAILFIAGGFLETVSAQTFTSEDEKVLKGSDSDAVAEILYKLSDLNESKGKEALKPAVPALIEALNRELRLPEEERWNLVDIVKVLSLTGDERVMPSLLKIMSVMWGGGNPFVAQGFLAIGPSTVKMVADSLKSANPDTRGRAALTLHNMKKYDDSGSFFTKDAFETIKKQLVDNLKDKNTNVRIYTVVALRSFGDESVLAPLEYVEKNDAHKDSGGTYEVRLEASETIKEIRARVGK